MVMMNNNEMVELIIEKENNLNNEMGNMKMQKKMITIMVKYRLMQVLCQFHSNNNSRDNNPLLDLYSKNIFN